MYIGKVPAVAALTASDITDGIISNAKLGSDIISAETALAVAPAATDEFLLSDAGVLKRIDASLVGRGKILQVVSGTVGSTSLANTSDYIGSGLSITPSSTSSKVLIFISGYTEQTSGSAGEYATLALYEATTNITTLVDAWMYQKDVGTRSAFSLNFIRSPSSTSSVQYRLHHTNSSGTATYAYKQQTWCLMEVAG